MNPNNADKIEISVIITEALAQGGRLLEHTVQISAIFLRHDIESGTKRTKKTKLCAPAHASTELRSSRTGSVIVEKWQRQHSHCRGEGVVLID